MKAKLALLLIILLTCSASYGQLNSCFIRSKGRHYTSLLELKNNGTYSHKLVSTGHLFLTSYEVGKYTVAGDTIIFYVTEFGLDKDALEPQSTYLERRGIKKGKRIVLIDNKGKTYEKLKKIECP